MHQLWKDSVLFQLIYDNTFNKKHVFETLAALIWDQESSAQQVLCLHCGSRLKALGIVITNATQGEFRPGGDCFVGWNVETMVFGCQDINVPAGDHQTHLCEGLEEYGVPSHPWVLGSSELLEVSMRNGRGVLDVAHMVVLYNGWRTIYRMNNLYYIQNHVSCNEAEPELSHCAIDGGAAFNFLTSLSRTDVLNM